MTRDRPDPDLSLSDTPYPKGLRGLLKRGTGGRAAIALAEGEALPPVDLGLTALRQAGGDWPFAALSSRGTAYFRLWRRMEKTFVDRPPLLALTMVLAEICRRDTPPPEAPALLARVWAEEARFLLARLDADEVLINLDALALSAPVAEDRALTRALFTLLMTLRIAHTGGLGNDQPDSALLPPLPLASGGSDTALLAPLWQMAQAEIATAPMAQMLLKHLVAEPDTALHRYARARDAEEARLKAQGVKLEARAETSDAPLALVVPQPVCTDPARLRWGTVSLVKARFHLLARFIAHHLSLGAARMEIYLDIAEGAAPSEADRLTFARLSAHPALRVTLCDDAFWQAEGRPRPHEHQLRQTYVATRAYARATDAGDGPDAPLDWLAHIDVDEFFLPLRSVAEVLAGADPQIAALTLPSVEQLAPDPKAPAGEETLFKRQPKLHGQSKAVLSDLYPTFGPHLDGGFLSHTAGKKIARTGLSRGDKQHAARDIRFGIHALRHDGRFVENTAPCPEIELGHAHAPTRAAFRAHLDYRLRHGSYRPSSTGALRVGDIIALLSEGASETEREAAIEAFFEEVCTATPTLVAGLETQGLLRRAALDLDAKAEALFAPLGKTAKEDRTR